MEEKAKYHCREEIFDHDQYPINGISPSFNPAERRSPIDMIKAGKMMIVASAEIAYDIAPRYAPIDERIRMIPERIAISWMCNLFMFKSPK
jgi:hypothetical protein